MSATPQSFHREFLKIAAPAVMETLARTLGNPELRAAVQRGLGGLGAGAGLGGLVGAAAGGVHGYREAKQQGAGTGDAVLHGLLRAPGGAGKGALLGSLGLGALEAAGAIPGAAGAATKAPGILGSAARFGQRQVHGLTGWTPRGFLDTEGARAIGAGTPLGNKPSAKAMAAAGRAQELGITSLPGFARSFMKQPVETIRAGVGHQWHAGSKLDKAMMVGLPAAAAASEFARDPEGRGGRLAGNAVQLGSLALGPVPLAGQLAAGAAGNAAVRRVMKPKGGTQASELGQNPAPPETASTANGLATPVERQYSDRAIGEIPVMSGAMQ